MKATCLREPLLTACQLVQPAVAPRSTKPIISMVKAIVAEDQLSLMATDLEIGIRYELKGVKTSGTGAAILPPDRLIPILKESTEPEITLNITDTTTMIKTASGRFELPNMDPAEFPDVPAFEASNYHEVTAGVLRKMIGQVKYAAEKKESTRWAVTGVLWELEGTTLKLIATDTKRLAIASGATTKVQGEVKGTSHIIPSKAIALLERNLADDGEIVRVALKTNEALFQTERALIHTRLVEGRFPPYRDIIPKKLATKVELPAAAFWQALRQAAIMMDDETRRVNFTFEAGRVTMKAHGNDVGLSEVELPLPDYAAADIEIAFDPSYLSEFLRSIDVEKPLTLNVTNGEKPAVFTSESLVYLVMPLAG